MPRRFDHATGYWEYVDDPNDVSDMTKKDAQKSVLTTAKRMRTMDALRSTVEKVDRIITGHYSMDVTLADDDMAHSTTSPGWTDGETVFINAIQLRKDIEDGKLSLTDLVVAYKGVNYHELGHLIFTPRLNESLPKQIKAEMAKPGGDQMLWDTWNILEDQRMEMLFVASYAPTVVYFRAIALKWLVGDTSSLPDSFPLTWGRKFLPLDLRLAMRDAYVAKYGIKNVQAISDIIDEFLLTVYPSDTTKGLKLVQDLLKLLHADQGVVICVPSGAMGANHGAPQQGRRGRNIPEENPAMGKGKASISDQKEATEWAQEWLDEEREELEERENPTAPDDSVADPDNDDDDDAGSPTPGEGPERFADPDSMVMPDLSEVLSDLSEQVQAALEDAMADEDLQADLGATSRSIQSAAAGAGGLAGDYGEHRDKQVKVSDIAASKKIQKLLLDLRHDLEPSWLKGESVGKLSIRRNMMRQANPAMFDIFDRWDEGSEEELSTEVVILLDQSGSMESYSSEMQDKVINKASEAMWILKSAFDKLDVKTTVLGFSDDWYILAKGDDKVSRSQTSYFDTYGGTDPSGALEQTLNIMLRSSAANKILFAISDGGWWSEAKSDAVIVNLKKMGVMTTLVGLGCDVEGEDNTHGMDVTKNVNSVDDIITIVKETVANIVRRLMQQHG